MRDDDTIMTDTELHEAIADQSPDWPAIQDEWALDEPTLVERDGSLASLELERVYRAWCALRLAREQEQAVGEWT